MVLELTNCCTECVSDARAGEYSPTRGTTWNCEDNECRNIPEMLRISTRGG